MSVKYSRGIPPENFGKTFTAEERRINSSKGGKASARVRAERKRTKEILEIFLSMPLKKRKSANIEEIKAFEELKGKNLTVNEAIQLKQIQRALNGDLNSASYIRDTVGDKQTENVSVEVNNPVAELTTEELRELIKSDS